MTTTSLLTGPRTSTLVDEPVPDCGPGQVLIRVLVNGVCASDLPEWTAGPADGPVRLGHEPVGEVVTTGPGVSGFAAGDLVTGRVTASFRAFALAEPADLVVVPPGLSPVAALGEPVGCVVEALRRTGVDVGDRVAVIGTGFMGLCLLQLLRHVGARQVVAIDPREDARRYAHDHGADLAVEPADAPGLAPFPTGSPAGFEVVFEASGTPAGLELAGALVAAQGTLSIMGYHQGPRTVDMASWNWRAIDVVNAHVRDRARLRDSVRRGIDLAAAGRIDLAALVTHRFPLAGVDGAFAALAAKEPGFIKAVVEID